MTKETAEFSQFTDAVACREYTLPRDEEASQPESWIRGNTKIGPVLEVTTCCFNGKYGVEIRIMSVNKDNSPLWVRISHGLNNLVTNLNNNEQETSEVQAEEYALKLNASDFACRSKAKAKPQRREPADSSTRTIPVGERIWTDVGRGEYSISDHAVSKKLIDLLRHGKVPREDDGAIESWRIKDDLQKYFLHCHHWCESMAPGGALNTLWGRVAFVSHVEVGEDRKLFASSHVGEPKPTGGDTQTAPTKLGIPPKLQAEVTVRPTLWLLSFLQQCVAVFRCSGEFSCV